MDKEVINNMEKAFWDNLQEVANKHPDFAELLSTYHSLVKEETFSNEFLDGYLACINDLTFTKKRLY